MQEVGFFLYTYIFSLISLSYKLLTSVKLIYLRNFIWTPLLIGIFFLPFAFLAEKNIPLPFFPKQLIESQTNHITSYGTFWIFGKWNGSRIPNTLGFFGFLPLVISAIYLLFHINNIFSNKTKSFMVAMLPGLMPFIVLFIPLNIMIWIRAVTSPDQVWRITYISQFWISVAFIFSSLEPIVNRKFKRIYIGFTNTGFWKKRNNLFTLWY